MLRIIVHRQHAKGPGTVAHRARRNVRHRLLFPEGLERRLPDAARRLSCLQWIQLPLRVSYSVSWLTFQLFDKLVLHVWNGLSS